MQICLHLNVYSITFDTTDLYHPEGNAEKQDRARSARQIRTRPVRAVSHARVRVNCRAFRHGLHPSIHPCIHSCSCSRTSVRHRGVPVSTRDVTSTLPLPFVSFDIVSSPVRTCLRSSSLCSCWSES
ncbi:hypothetical protein AMECASPLE_017962 [Ameca splendens]|uniref:NADP-dependent oxidoreductase domain-containing protein n=1 Tax=Ameca splendens TaxID=208324 RepID=A0ABV0ZN94_9TELE